MDETTNAVKPVLLRLFRVSGNELFATALVSSAVVTAAYQIGRERQRKFVEKHMELTTKNR